jgi:hypothetical protein
MAPEPSSGVVSECRVRSSVLVNRVVMGRIMDYRDFSKAAFEACRGEESRILRLLDQLDERILSDLHDCIARRMSEIEAALNAQGHQLKRNSELEEPGRTDSCETHGAETCGFRVATDLTVSLGYYGVWRQDPALRDGR